MSFNNNNNNNDNFLLKKSSQKSYKGSNIVIRYLQVTKLVNKHYDELTEPIVNLNKFFRQQNMERGAQNCII